VLRAWKTPQQWALDGILLNNDLTVPPGGDWQQPPPAVLADAWTWPETAAGQADTLPELTRVTGNPLWLERAVTHVLGAHRWLYDPGLRLWRHLGRPTGPDPRAVPWGRGNAWFLYALRGLLEGLPADHPRRPEAIAALAAGFEGIHARQQPDGLWLNVLDAAPDASRPCASATGRFLEVYGQAYLAGWLRDPRIPPMVERAWLGLKTKIWRHGLVANCVGTAYGLSRQVYLARPHHTFRPSRSALLVAWITRQRLAALGQSTR
jgi:rhamnogalacturonyl hydrolase YesR